MTEHFLEPDGERASGFLSWTRTTLPCKVTEGGRIGIHFRIILIQGLNRQIRRMCDACGCQVKRLVRVRIMNIRLGNLRTGAYRRINQEEQKEFLGLLKHSYQSVPIKRERINNQENRMEDKIQRMKELVSILPKAGKAYYQESREIMSNFEYDRLYDELVCPGKGDGGHLVRKSHQKVGYEVLSELPKEAHESPMLSLDKTKECGGAAGMAGRPEGTAVLEDGRPDHCAHLRGRNPGKGGYQGKRGNRRGDYAQRPGVCQYPVKYRLQGTADSPGRGGHYRIRILNGLTSEIEDVDATV